MSVDNITECCLHKNSISNEKILIFGGSGSLGTCSILRWIRDNQVMNVSRDEEKQWLLRNAIRSDKLTQMIGDITNQDDVDKAILQYKPICVQMAPQQTIACMSTPMVLQLGLLWLLWLNKTRPLRGKLFQMTLLVFDQTC